MNGWLVLFLLLVVCATCVDCLACVDGWTCSRLGAALAHTEWFKMG